MEKFVCETAQIAESLEKTINDGGVISLVVTGNSMAPFLKDGRDTVLLKKPEESDFVRGRILLFKRENGALILHRVRKILPDNKLEMNGDAQYWCEAVDKSQVIGVVTRILRDGKEIHCTKNTFWHVLKPIRPFIFRAQKKILKIRSNSNEKSD